VNTGSHYKGLGNGTHGCPDDNEHDTGDLGYWTVFDDGTLLEDKTFNLTYLTGSLSLIGRAVVLHNLTDNCISAGASGARIAQCVIGIGNPALFPNNASEINVASNDGVNVGTLAVCNLQPTEGNSVYGVATFEELEGAVRVTAVIEGLAFGSIHAFHIHQFGDLSSEDGSAAGSHYNPLHHAHALPPNTTRHVGDLGNICTYVLETDTHSAFYQALLTTPIPYVNGETYNIIGLSLIVHSLPDTGGDSYGSRLAQCVIGIGNPVTTASPTLPANCCSDPVCHVPYEIPISSGPGTTSSSSSGTSSQPIKNPDDSGKTLTIIGSILLAITVLGIAFIVIFFFTKIRRAHRSGEDRYKPFLDDSDQ